jgi:hypothetical protein
VNKYPSLFFIDGIFEVTHQVFSVLVFFRRAPKTRAGRSSGTIIASVGGIFDIFHPVGEGSLSLKGDEWFFTI